LNILITGGSGFLGRNLALELSKSAKNKIHIFDIKEFKTKRKNIFFHKCNLNKSLFIKNNFFFDYIFHMAAELGVKNVMTHPIKTLDINYNSTKNIITFAKKNKRLKRLFFFSTSEVYSKLNKEGKMSERDDLQLPDIHHPRTSYWFAKTVGEFLIIHSNIPYTIFRIFNVYGPYTKATHVIPSIFEKLRKSKKIIFQNSEHIRAFIFIEDIVKIFILSMNKRFKNQILNVGNPSEPIKIKSLIKKISLITNIKKKYSFKNVKNQSIKKRIPDIKKLKFLMKKKIKFTKFNDGLNIIYEKNKNR